MSDAVVGNILTGVGIFGGWFLTVLSFRRIDRERALEQRKEDRKADAQKHEQNIASIRALERVCAAISERVARVEEGLEHLRGRRE